MTEKKIQKKNQTKRNTHTHTHKVKMEESFPINICVLFLNTICKCYGIITMREIAKSLLMQQQTNLRLYLHYAKLECQCGFYKEVISCHIIPFSFLFLL